MNKEAELENTIRQRMNEQMGLLLSENIKNVAVINHLLDKIALLEKKKK